MPDNDADLPLSSPSAIGSSPPKPDSVFPFRLPLAPDPEKGWRPYRFFDRSTPNLGALHCHASALAQGRSPHPPHTHDEEELLLLLAGEVDLLLPSDPEGPAHGRRRLRTGQFVYYPAGFPHTIETVSQEPANYLMFKWRGGASHSDAPLSFGQFEMLERPPASAGDGDGFRTAQVFDGPTACLRRLHCHTSAVAPGAGYAPHADTHDVALVLLEGEVETLGQRIAAPAVIFHEAGELHGMRNPGDTPARYLVFEFHGAAPTLRERLVER